LQPILRTKARSTRRFQFLTAYASASEGRNGKADGILFTCSAFGPAIDAVKEKSSTPVLRPNEAAFDIALDRGANLALLVSFEPSAATLESELHEMAIARGKSIKVTTVFAAGALDALKRGDAEAHDRIVAEVASGMGHADAVILGQFSLARARAAVERKCQVPIVTTPRSAVEGLKRMILRRDLEPEAG